MNLVSSIDIGISSITLRHYVDSFEIDKYKVRATIHGFMQLEGRDFNWYETFAPVAALVSVRICLALAAAYNIHIHSS